MRGNVKSAKKIKKFNNRKSRKKLIISRVGPDAFHIGSLAQVHKNQSVHHPSFHPQSNPHRHAFSTCESFRAM